MTKKQKIGTIIGTIGGAAILATAIVIPVVLNINEVNKNIILSKYNAQKFYKILENNVEPNENITVEKLNADSVINNVKNIIANEFNISNNLIHDVKFSNNQGTLFDISITFSDDANIHFENNDYFTLSFNTITTKNPIDYGLISWNNEISNNLYNILKNYLLDNNNDLYENISTGSKYENLINQLKQVLNNQLIDNKNIENVQFELLENNTKVNVAIEFNTNINDKSLGENFIVKNKKSIITSIPINVNIYKNINLSNLNFNIVGVSELIYIALDSHSNNYQSFINEIQKNDNFKNLFLKANNKITTMNYIDCISGCIAKLNNNAIDFVIKLNNNDLGGNVYINFSISLDPNQKLFIFDTNLTKITGLTTYGQQQTIIDLSAFKKLTSIGSSAFSNCTNITSVKLPDTINTIENNAFENCTNLTEIVLPNSDITLGNSVFINCSKLSNIDLSNVIKIGNEVFKNCSNLRVANLIKLNNLTSSSFTNCTSLETVVLNNKIEKIPYYCFDGCTNLTNVNLPNSVTTIEGRAFTGTNIASIDLSNVANLNGNNIFQDCKNLSNVTLCESLTSIPNYAFQNCSNLVEINLPKNIRTLGEWVFRGTGLHSIDISNVTTLSTKTFEDCVNLSSVILGNSLAAIPNYTFNGCTNLTTINLPKSITTIERDAFKNTGLTTINFNDGSNINEVRSSSIPNNITINVNNSDGISLSKVQTAFNNIYGATFNFVEINTIQIVNYKEI